ncbi:MAG TPA: hypothetical protein VHO43_04220 [Ignavibacteriales bacterium]|nr:hypothetical protein [Ignavibacteriales bacterium]
MPLKKSAYNEWSIEKGDYIRKDLSKQDMIYKNRMSPLLRAVISGLVLLAVILAVVLKIQHF